MNFLFLIAEKILFIMLLMGAGVLVKKANLVSNEGEKDLSRLMLDFFWPALIFSSITRALTAEDILSNIWLPILSFLLHLFGFGVGLLMCRIMGLVHDRKKVFVFQVTMNNFLIMALPFAQLFYPEKGAALLSTANLGSTIALWTLGVSAISGRLNARQTLRNLLTPGLIVTLVAITLVLSGFNRYIPTLVNDALSVAGQPTLLIGLLIAGTQIYKLGRKALKFDRWNIMVGLLRNILIPGFLFIVALTLRGIIAREALVIFMLVAIAPASVNSISLAYKYGSSPELAAEGVLFTHLLGMGSMLGFVYLINRFLV